MRRRLVIVLALLGCGEAPSAPPPATTPDAGPPAIAPIPVLPEPVEEAMPVEPENTAPRAGESIVISSGVVLAGSRPGALYREPRDEADLVAVELPEFAIDRLPYPNDPARPPRTQVSRDEAAALCREDGKRLCTELEWERACEGEAAERLFPNGNAFDPSCTLASCASPDGVLGLGVVGEWTASDGNRGLASDLAVFRGSSSEEPGLHRCASRRGARPSTRSAGLGFRCCSGALPSVAYPEESRVARYAPLTLDREAARAILRDLPELARYADHFELFDQEGMSAALGGDLTPLNGWELPETGALRWSPRTGELVHVFAGRSGEAALLVVVHPMPDGTFVHGASFVREGQPQTIVIAFTPP
ncbi:MAG: SUMF1/EgtB/PvdO family nonheme iron enzyme, partial [Sandaracinus sp.]|nr:SUMF1/EgtB/PvdO family nonheme iron enzyme [Sandaracinus sp.]